MRGGARQWVALVCPVEKAPRYVFALACGRVASVRMLCIGSCMWARNVFRKPGIVHRCNCLFIVVQYRFVDRSYLPILPHCDKAGPEREVMGC